MNTMNTLSEYKALERGEHISSDDILNKTTQEVLELLMALESGENHEIFSEAGDVLVNVVSLALELGCDMQSILESHPGETSHMLPLL